MALTEQELTEVERRVRMAADTGALVDLRSGVLELDDPATGGAWDLTRTIRAELLAEVLTRPVPADNLPAQPLRLYGARVSGNLNLQETALVRPALLQDCYLDEPINLEGAKAQAIRLPGCQLLGLKADRLETSSDLQLNRGFAGQGEVRLAGAHIKGVLDFSGAHLTNAAGPALTGDGLTVDQHMLCGEGFTVQGEVRLAGAHIKRRLDFSGAQLTNATGPALMGDGLTVNQDLLCGEGFTAQGEVRLFDAHISGVLDSARVNLSEASSFGNHCVVAVPSFGWLIQAAPGNAGGSGGLWTKRSGCWA